MQKPIERLSNLLPISAQDIVFDAVLILDPVNRRYLTEFPSSAGMVLVTADQAYFLTDFRYAEAARKQIKDCEVVCYQKPAETLTRLLKQHQISSVLLEYSTLTLSQADHFDRIFQEVEVKTSHTDLLDRILKGMRAIKSETEIKKIEASQQITDAAFQYILPKIHPGVTEKEIALDIEFFMRRQGAQGVAFDLIVVSGTNGSQCHGVPSDKKISAGELVTMDIGALLDGYHSDMTRTVAVGSVTEEQKAVYYTVLNAQNAAIAAVHAGVSCGEVDRAARAIIESKYPGTFGHSTGHSVGLEIHEWPNFAPGQETVAEEGMVITVEPGIYLEGRFGVRIEDMIVVEKNGCRDLTHSPKDFIILS